MTKVTIAFETEVNSHDKEKFLKEVKTYLEHILSDIEEGYTSGMLRPGNRTLGSWNILEDRIPLEKETSLG